MNVVNPYSVNLKHHGWHAVGNLIAIEEIGFSIQRVFCIFGVPTGVERGHHSHTNTSQFLVCPTGRVDIQITNANGDFHFTLDTPTSGIMMPPNNYIVMKNFSRDCVLMVMADTLHSNDIVCVS